MITLLGYVVLLIAMWALLGKLFYPTQSPREKLAGLVAQNRNLLIAAGAERRRTPRCLTSLEIDRHGARPVRGGRHPRRARRRRPRALRPRRRGRRRRRRWSTSPTTSMRCSTRATGSPPRSARTARCAGRKRAARPSRSPGWRRASSSSSRRPAGCVRRVFPNLAFTARAEWIIMGA